MTVSMMFSPQQAKRGLTAEKFIENARKGAVAQGLAAETVAGLGDEAFCLPATGASIFFRTGDVVMTVGGSSNDCSVARQFAEKAIARL